MVAHDKGKNKHTATGSPQRHHVAHTSDAGQRGHLGGPEDLSVVAKTLDKDGRDARWTTVFADIVDQTNEHFTNVYGHMVHERTDAARETTRPTGIMSRGELTEAFRKLLQAPRQSSRYHHMAQALDTHLRHTYL